ncbi:MAG: deoxyribonuclease IV [Thermodesulfobacteriota bacterium]|nr:deoxyribonuclease IV [Thermodesulfobacteriota bacterium]
MRYIGIHVSIAGGIHKSLRRAKTLNVNATQIFLKNAKSWRATAYKESVIKKFHSEKNSFTNIKIFAHSIYLNNLASKGKAERKTLNEMIDEIASAESLDIEHIVVHPGSHEGDDEDSAINRIAGSLDRIFQRTEKSKVKILLETTAGVDRNLGYRFEHLRDIMALSNYPERIAVCLDTSHIFTAGYDISNSEGYHGVIEEFDRIIGLENLKLIHLNDSKTELGSRIDRHEHIGLGYIGDSGFSLILNDERLKHVPMILETPKIVGDSDSDIILKDIPMILDKSRKIGLSYTDTVLKDIPAVIDKSKRLGLSIGGNIIKKGQNIFEKSRDRVTSKAISGSINISDIFDKSLEISASLSDSLLKDSLEIYEDAKLSVFEVDRMNIDRVYSLMEDRE